MLTPDNKARLIGGVPCIIRATCESTSSDEAVLAADARHSLTVATIEQTAGRGQRGNKWESAPGMNLSYTTVLRPDTVNPRDQFAISMAVSLGIVDAIDPLLTEALGIGASSRLKIKWPNDIYYNDLKLAGILIQHSISGSVIDRTLAGIGININQREFTSPAPNPVSLSMITGREYELDELLGLVLKSIMGRINMLMASTATSIDNLLDDYHRRLWRHDGNSYRWLVTADSSIITGALDHVGRDGMLHISGHTRVFAFKEIHPLLG